MTKAEEFRNRQKVETIEDKIIKAIASIKTNSVEEELKKTEYLMNINKFLGKYEENKKILNNHERGKEYERE